MSTAVLEIQGISKTMGKRKVVDNVSFTVNAGEVFGFLGPNGAGKTTTIKMALGLLSIDAGEVFINGHSVKKEYEKALEKVGGIIENPEMYGYLTGMTNLQLFARMHGSISRQRIEEVVKQVKLGNRVHDKVRKYSLGMRQRLGVAQAILHAPNLLILDEPTNGLDPVGIKELRDTLRGLAETKNVAVLVSSHLLSEMELMCDRIGIIDNGRMIDVKTLQDIHESTQTVLSSYTIEVSDPQVARAVLTGYNDQFVLTEQGGLLSFDAMREDIAKINRLLVQHDVDVYSITSQQKTLEDAFMEVTNGSKTQIS